LALVVVEARERSGALTTADFLSQRLPEFLKERYKLPPIRRIQ
jgi:hypothetical protein